MNILQNALNNKIREEEEKKKKGQGALSSVYGQNTAKPAGMGGASGGGLLSVEKNAAGQSANTGAGGTGIGHQMFVDSLRRNQTQQAAGGRNAISPFGVAHLDEKYQQTVRDLYNAGGSNKNGLNPLEDAYNIVNDYSNTVRASFELNKNAPEGKNPVQIGENAYQEAMKKALTRYQYNGASAEDMRSGLESMHYMSPKAQEEANRQSVIDYAAQFMPAKAKPETKSSKADLYHNMGQVFSNANLMGYEGLPEDQQAVYMEALEAGVGPHDMDALNKWGDKKALTAKPAADMDKLYRNAAGVVNAGTMYGRNTLSTDEERQIYDEALKENPWLQQVNLEDMTEEEADRLNQWGEKKAGRLNAPTYEEADAWMTQNKPLYALAKENKGDIQGLQSTYRNVNGILDKFANGQHGNDLSARELEVLYAAQDAGLIGTNETEYATLSPEQKTALAAWGGSQAQEIGQYGKMVTVSKPSAEQDTLLAMYHDTLDGAKAWAEEAKGTEDEQPAKDNLWFIEKRTKFEEEKTNGDIERYGQADAGFHSGNAQLDSAYAIINDIDNAAGTEVLSLLASNHGNEDALNFRAQLTDEEKATFNALANSGKYEDALEYLDYKRYEVRERAQNEAAELVYKATNEHGALGAVAGSALSVPLSVFRGVGTADIALQNFRNAISGDYRPVDYNTQAQMLGRAADSMRQGVMDQVNWSVNILGRDTDLFDFIYGTGMSGIDSAAAGALGGWTGAALLGAGAAQSAMQELHDAGGNDRQVVLGGLLAGAFETLFEHISIDKFYNEAKHLGKRTFKDAMSNVLAQAGINFSEEFNTELADVISEKLIMGDKWDMNRQRDEYMRLGMTEQEANNRMAEDITYRLLEAGLGGALMGAGFGAVSNVSSNTATSKLDKKTGNYFSGDARNTLKSLGESMTGEARDQAARYDPAKASDKETGALYRTIVQGLPAEFRGTIRETMALDALNNMQANGPADMQAAGALMALLEGQNLDVEQLTALARSEGGMQAVYDIMGIENMGRALAENQQTLTQTQEEAADAGAEMPEELERGLKAPQTLGERMNVREEAETQAHAQPQQQRQALGERMNVREDAETRAPAANQQPGQPQQRQALGERMTVREDAETRIPAAKQARELQELGERMRTIAQSMAAQENTETQAPATEQRAQAEEQARALQELGERMRTIAQQMAAQENAETQAAEDQAPATEQRSPAAEQARELQELGERMRTIAQQMTARENAETQAPAAGHARELQALGERMRTIAQQMAVQENTEAQETMQPGQPQQQTLGERMNVREDAETRATAAEQQSGQLKPQALGERMNVREDAETRAPAAEQQPGQPQQQALGERMNVREDAETRAPAAEQQPGQPQQQALGERMTVREERTVNLEGRGVNLTTYGTESARPAAQIEKSGDGLAVRFEDGSAASLSALNAQDGEGAVLGRASFMEDQDAAMDMIEAYNGDKDFDTGDNYAVAYQQVYEKAAKGQPADSVKSIFRDNLTDDQAQSALRAGQREYLRREAMAQAANERAAKEAGFAALEKNTGDKAGVFFARVDSGMKGKDGEIDRKKAATFRVLDLYAQEKGLQIRVFDNLDVENGSYVQGENVINLALNAEESAYTHTVSHEIFHYLRQFAPEAAENIKQFVADTLKAVAGYDYDQRIRDVQEKYRTAKGEELTDAQAEDEITADSLVDVIGTEENVNKLVRTQGVSITEKISQWIKNSVQAFRNILNRLAGKSPEVAALKDNADYLDRVRGMVDSALDTAKENYREARSTLTEAALRDADVQAYEAGMETASTEAAAEEERNALASNLFARYYEKAARMLEGIDYEDAYNKFVSALKSFGNKDTQDLATAMKRQGLPAQSADMNPALSYAARQLAAAEQKAQTDVLSEKTDAAETITADLPENVFSLREDTGAQQAERAAESVRGDAELYAQARTDEDLNAAIQLLDTLHYQTTQGGADAPIQRGAFEKRLGDIADKYIEQTGTKYGRVKLMGELRKIYQAMEQKEYSPGEVLTYARQLMRDVLDKSPGVLVELDDSTKEALRVLKSNSFFLTDGQKSEIRGTYGSVADYLRKNFGKLRIASQKNAKVSLAEVWRESLTPLNPGTFAEDANEADMPGILDAFLERAGEKRYDGSIGDVVGLSTDFALKAMLDFYDVPGALQGKENIRDDFRAKAEKWRTDYQDKYQQRIQKSQERKEETIRKQKLRARITADVRRLNALAVTNTDNKHVPADMRAAVLSAVKPFLEAETGVFSRAEMQRLSNEYAILQQRSGEIRGFDEDILATIQDLGNRLDGRRLSKLTEQELSDLSDVVGNIRHMVAEANEAVVNGRKTTVDELSAELKNDMRSKGQAKDGKFAEKVRKLSYKETTPTYYAERVGGVIRDMVRDLFDGQNKWAFTMNAAKEFLGDDSRFKKTGVFGKYHVNDWINDKETLRIVTQAGDQIELNRQEALSLYALWKRETTNKIQNANHLRIGGFMYDKGAKYEGVDTLKPHAIAEADMEKVKNYLGKEQMDFADEMVKYLTETLGAVGNEVSLRLYGYEKFKEDYYFPYETDRRFLAGDLTQNGEPVKQPKNAGMTKATLRNAATPITVHNFMDVWAGHVNQMALYQAFAETIDTMNRVLNARAAGEIHTDSLTGLDHVIAPESNWVEMERALGEEGVQYLKTLVRDVSGGVRADERGMMAKGLSAFKKASVAGNLSVVLQQPTAYARALMMVNPRYLLASNPAKLSKNIKTMYQYSGVALIKNMGKFDTGTGKGAVQWLTDGVREASAGKRVLDSIDTVTGIGAEKADEWTWGLLWGAIENETKHTRADLTDGTEDFYRAVAQRFEDVVNHTQVYDSVLSRSEWMRGTSTMDKMATSFMAEPTLSLNMLMDTIVRFREDGQGGRKVARAAATFLFTTMLTSLAKSIVTATRRKDDEGRTWLEKYLAEAAGNFVDDVSPFGLAGMIAWARDAVSIFEGYDVARSDMDAVTKLYKAYQTVTNENKSMEDKLQETCGAVGYLFGIPIKNVWRDTEAVIRNLFGGGSAEGPSTARDIKYSVLDSVGKIGPFTLWNSKNAAYYERMEQALIAGDEEKFRELRDYMEDTNQIDGKAVISGVKKAVKQSVQRGLISDEKATELLEKYLGADAGKGWQTVEQWKQTAAHAEDEDYSYSKYGELLSAVKAGKGVQEEKNKLLSHGEEEKELQGEIKSAVGEWYRNGEIDRKTAEKTLREQVPTLDSNALYWQLDKWDHEKINGESAAYNKYGSYIQAVRTGKDLRAETKRYLDHGVDKDTLAKQITSAFKNEYINLYKTNRSAALSLRGYLANAYAALGYDREKKLKDIDRWLKDMK